MPVPSHVLRRSLALAATAPLALALAACGSGGSGNDATPAQPTSSSTQVGAAQNKCAAQVDVTGAVKVSWKGDAQVVIQPSGQQASGPDASYFAVDGKNQLSTYSSGTDFPASVTLAVGKTAYSSAGQDVSGGLDASTDGTKATVDLDLADVDGTTAHVTATYTCGTKAIAPTYKNKPTKKPGKKG